MLGKKSNHHSFDDLHYLFWQQPTKWHNCFHWHIQRHGSWDSTTHNSGACTRYFKAGGCLSKKRFTSRRSSGVIGSVFKFSLNCRGLSEICVNSDQSWKLRFRCGTLVLERLRMDECLRVSVVTVDPLAVVERLCESIEATVESGAASVESGAATVESGAFIIVTFSESVQYCTSCNKSQLKKNRGSRSSYPSPGIKV